MSLARHHAPSLLPHAFSISPFSMHGHISYVNDTDPTWKISTMRDVHRRGIESDTDNDMNEEKKRKSYQRGIDIIDPSSDMNLCGPAAVLSASTLSSETIKISSRPTP